MSRVVFHKSVQKDLLFNIKPTTIKTIDKAVVMWHNYRSDGSICKNIRLTENDVRCKI